MLRNAPEYGNCYANFLFYPPKPTHTFSPIKTFSHKTDNSCYTIPMLNGEITTIAEKFKESLNPLRIYLFGSYARGEEKETSDVDIRIESDIKNLLVMGGFYADIKDTLGKDLDILSRLPDSEKFKANLKRDEVLIYER